MDAIAILLVFLFLISCVFGMFFEDDKLTKDNEEFWRREQEDAKKRGIKMTIDNQNGTADENV